VANKPIPLRNAGTHKGCPYTGFRRFETTPAYAGVSTTIPTACYNTQTAHGHKPHAIRVHAPRPFFDFFSASKRDFSSNPGEGIDGGRRGFLDAGAGAPIIGRDIKEAVARSRHHVFSVLQRNIMADYVATLPSLGEDAGDEATVSFVYVDSGDIVKEGDDLVEMVTDKATFNVPSPKAGTIKKMRVSEGDTVKVGDPICDMDV
jgi:biotin carboxyl carrier protein